MFQILNIISIKFTHDLIVCESFTHCFLSIILIDSPRLFLDYHHVGL